MLNFLSTTDTYLHLNLAGVTAPTYGCKISTPIDLGSEENGTDEPKILAIVLNELNEHPSDKKSIISIQTTDKKRTKWLLLHDYDDVHTPKRFARSDFLAWKRNTVDSKPNC